MHSTVKLNFAIKASANSLISSGINFKPLFGGGGGFTDYKKYINMVTYHAVFKSINGIN